MHALTGAPWLVLLLLGAAHGLNPGMGWLFAVALGLQEGRGAAVWRALGPLAAGHAAAVALAVAVAAALGAVLPLGVLRWGVAALLLGFALHRVLLNRHPRFGGMRVSQPELAVWSFLMASAHGAGLMVVPVLLSEDLAPSHAHHHLPQRASLVASPAHDALLATAIHTAGYLLVTGLLAVVVYHKLGLRLLRTAWVNLDLLWAGALVVTAVVVVS
ncbi:MAG: hypothetical protein IPK12_07390 [Gemmatimonadetes bacterium]|nr:hypothetical protein [Gemmatimonadota bacterium]